MIYLLCVFIFCILTAFGDSNYSTTQTSFGRNAGIPKPFENTTSDGFNSSRTSSNNTLGLGRMGAERIIGGYPIDIRRVPYQVSVKTYGSHVCGGALISEYNVLTAAHCFHEDVSLYDITVQAGSNDNTFDGDNIDIRNYIIHPKYNLPTKHNYDAAVIFLDRIPDYRYPIAKINLASYPAMTHEYVLVTGWGAVEEDGVPDNPTLQAVWVLVTEHHQCKQMYAPDATITDQMFCAGDVNGGKDACSGDSGGPAAATDGTLLGIVSFGQGCGRNKRPGVYVSVPHIRSWVLSIIWGRRPPPLPSTPKPTEWADQFEDEEEEEDED